MPELLNRARAFSKRHLAWLVRAGAVAACALACWALCQAGSAEAASGRSELAAAKSRADVVAAALTVEARDAVASVTGVTSDRRSSDAEVCEALCEAMLTWSDGASYGAAREAMASEWGCEEGGTVLSAVMPEPELTVTSTGETAYAIDVAGSSMALESCECWPLSAQLTDVTYLCVATVSTTGATGDKAEGEVLVRLTVDAAGQARDVDAWTLR